MLSLSPHSQSESLHRIHRRGGIEGLSTNLLLASQEEVPSSYEGVTL